MLLAGYTQNTVRFDGDGQTAGGDAWRENGGGPEAQGEGQEGQGSQGAWLASLERPTGKFVVLAGNVWEYAGVADNSAP